MDASMGGPVSMKKPYSLHRFFVGVLLATTLVVCLVTLVVWQSSLRQQQDQLRESRFQFSLTQVRASLESGLRLGFATGDLPGAQNLIEQVRARQSDILSIDIFDSRGTILFSTDQGGLGSSVPMAWRNPCTAGAGALWRGQTQDSDLQCVALVNSFDQVAGGVMLRYRLPSRAVSAVELPQAWPLMLMGVLVVVGMAASQGRAGMQALDQRALALRLALLGKQSPPEDHDPLWGHAVQPGIAAMARLEAELAQTDAEAERLDKLEAS